MAHRRELGLTEALAETQAWMVATHAAMVAGDVAGVLAALVARRTLLAEGLVATVRLGRSQGMTWEEIADAMGTTKQNVWASYRVYTREWDRD